MKVKDLLEKLAAVDPEAEVGHALEWAGNKWTVVGIFDAGGRVADSELWCDAKVLQPAYRRGNSFQSVYVRLESADAFASFKDALTSDRRLTVQVDRERDYYEQQSRQLTQVITVLGTLIAARAAPHWQAKHWN